MMYEVIRDFAGPVATIIASFTAAGVTFYFGRFQTRIATQQARTAALQAELAAARLRHDLYERRFSIYAATRDLLLGNVYPHTNISDAALTQFLRYEADARFLLNDDLAKFLDEIADRSIKLKTLNTRLQNAHQQNRIESLEDQKEELMSWFDGKFQVLADKFQPLLGLENGKLYS